MIRCPHCGEEVVPAYHEHDSIETHGLECGPYERWHDKWWECPACGEQLTPEDLDRSV